jgi:hypothetical protein
VRRPSRGVRVRSITWGLRNILRSRSSIVFATTFDEKKTTSGRPGTRFLPGARAAVHSAFRS